MFTSIFPWQFDGSPTFSSNFVSAMCIAVLKQVHAVQQFPEESAVGLNCVACPDFELVDTNKIHGILLRRAFIPKIVDEKLLCKDRSSADINDRTPN